MLADRLAPRSETKPGGESAGQDGSRVRSVIACEDENSFVERDFGLIGTAGVEEELALMCGKPSPVETRMRVRPADPARRAPRRPALRERDCMLQ